MLLIQIRYNIIHATEKSLKDLGEDKVSADEKAEIDKAIEELKEAAKGDDKAAIEAKTTALAEKSGKLAEKLYAEKGAGEAPAGAEGGEKASGGDDVVDAEFEEVKDDNSKA